MYETIVITRKGKKQVLLVDTLATSCEELTHWKRLWCWEGLGAGEGTTEDEMAGRHHQLDGHEFEWTPGVGDGQGGLECCDSWGCKESDMTERMNWTELNWIYRIFLLLSLKVKVWKSLSSVQLFVTPRTIQSMEFSRPESGVGSFSFLQQIFPTQGSNPCLPHCRQILYQLSHKGSPILYC